MIADGRRGPLPGVVGKQMEKGIITSTRIEESMNKRIEGGYRGLRFCC